MNFNKYVKRDTHCIAPSKEVLQKIQSNKNLYFHRNSGAANTSDIIRALA